MALHAWYMLGQNVMHRIILSLVYIHDNYACIVYKELLVTMELGDIHAYICIDKN